ncbi:hypothetical protein CVIRNUC_009810 [Coccomyxa viridis]|uniref:Uncharacterized protein n=1 Tax=Coccomyxa viridis TaxID=1274662 RepID=A0AAV1IIF6_9CHLO|nr:hypothetical protein CVIRNUC_009810 [Coccomyxa viridis]
MTLSRAASNTVVRPAAQHRDRNDISERSGSSVYIVLSISLLPARMHEQHQISSPAEECVSPKPSYSSTSSRASGILFPGQDSVQGIDLKISDHLIPPEEHVMTMPHDTTSVPTPCTAAGCYKCAECLWNFLCWTMKRRYMGATGFEADGYNTLMHFFRWSLCGTKHAHPGARRIIYSCGPILIRIEFRSFFLWLEQLQQKMQGPLPEIQPMDSD